MEAGRVVSNYVVEKHLGSGGMAEVYLVRHRVLNSVHALKVLHLERAKKGSLRARFLSEGRLQAQIRHPNIAAVTDVVAESGVAGLIVEFLRGGSLEDRMSRGLTPVAPAAMLDVLGPVIDALATAHGKGVIHRDLKPANILFRDETLTAPVLSDFGIAKVVGESEIDNHRQHRTRTGLVMGTPGYMSPEQVRGQGDIGPGVDLFAMGVMAWELMTGMSPYRGGSDFEVMQAIVDGERPSLAVVAPELGDELVSVVERALHIDPSVRYDDARTLGAELAAAVEAMGDGAHVAPTRLRDPLRPLGPATWTGAGIAATVDEGVGATAPTMAEAITPVRMPTRGAVDETLAPDEPLRFDGPRELRETVAPAEAPAVEAPPVPPPAPAAEPEEEEDTPWMFYLAVGFVVMTVGGFGGVLIFGAFAWDLFVSEPEVEEHRLQPKMAVDVGYKMQMVAPDGPQRVGSPPDERGRDEDEAQLSVEVAPFLLGRNEVTQGQWETAMRDHPVRDGTDTEGRSCAPFGLGDDLPVVCVSWYDVVQFANRMSNLEGLEEAYEIQGGKVTWFPEANGYRLPTESEWEVAARAGGADRYGRFDDVGSLCKHATGATPATLEAFDQLSIGATTACTGKPGLRSVGTLQPNRHKLYDTLGSVSEWTWDIYYPAGVSPVPANQTMMVARSRQASGERVVRGGSWVSGPHGLRVSERASLRGSSREGHVGVRLARNAP